MDAERRPPDMSDDEPPDLYLVGEPTSGEAEETAIRDEEIESAVARHPSNFRPEPPTTEDTP